MKRIFPLIMLMMAASPLAARADIVHRISASTQLTVDAAASQASRIGSSYTVQGTNITAGTMGGLSAQTGATAAAGHTDGVYTVTTAGDAFSLTESFTLGDATNTIGSGSDVSAYTYTAADSSGTPGAQEAWGNVTDLPAFGITTTTAGGYTGGLAGTIATDGAITLTAGGSGTSATGQIVSEVTIR